MQNNKNFGLSDSLITSVKEAMNPNQKKLDKNNNGKLDADDFKKLRGEDAEVDEAQTPQQKAAQAALATQRGEYDAGKKGGAINRMALMKKKALQKIAMGKTKNEEVEQVDEEKYTYKAATFNGNTVEGTGPTQEDAIKDAKEKAKKMNTTIRKRISMKKEDVTREETEITEADDAVAKQIKARKEQIKKQIQQKIAQKQMSVMQQKAQKTIQNIKASNDKDVYVNMKKKGKDEIEVSPELREAEDFPSDRNSHGKV